ncbi:hypothetical protein L596_015660 [Steinernema carpocapsae]|uniref:Uncharacterized protein n=1 Tax=Steinernema carpocapsae TaxID=34508 RepID=A0A4V6A366_STECR|nr:hypothetical protein L596_015660 [Steinernema carpocapsae]
MAEDFRSCLIQKPRQKVQIGLEVGDSGHSKISTRPGVTKTRILAAHMVSCKWVLGSNLSVVFSGRTQTHFGQLTNRFLARVQAILALEEAQKRILRGGD